MKITIFILISVLFILVSCKENKYKIKNNKVYYISWNEAHGKKQHLIKKVDAKTFKELKNSFGKDKNNVFYKINLLENSDPKSFKIMSKYYALDNNQAYYNATIIPLKNVKNFKILNKQYVTNGIDIFFNGKKLNVCNVSTFKILNQDKSNTYYWSTDGCYYYVNNHKIQSKNYKDIVYFKNSSIAKDKEFIYDIQGKLNYRKGKKLFDIDAETFNIDEKGQFDKDGYFTFYERSKGYKFKIN